jgi:hypothetical protein
LNIQCVFFKSRECSRVAWRQKSVKFLAIGAPRERHFCSERAEKGRLMLPLEVNMKVLLTILLVLAGCATPRGPELKEGNSETAVVSWLNSTQGVDGAHAVADAHCGRFGKTARYAGKANIFLLAYECVK